MIVICQGAYGTTVAMPCRIAMKTEISACTALRISWISTWIHFQWDFLWLGPSSAQNVNTAALHSKQIIRGNLMSWFPTPPPPTPKKEDLIISCCHLAADSQVMYCIMHLLGLLNPCCHCYCESCIKFILTSVSQPPSSFGFCKLNLVSTTNNVQCCMP